MPKPLTVTQAELAGVIAAYTAVENSILEIRRRLAAGASVETGALECLSRTNEQPLEFIETKYHSLFGLEIGPAESPLRAHDVTRRKKVGHA
jgi:hypothetical protein